VVEASPLTAMQKEKAHRGTAGRLFRVCKNKKCPIFSKEKTGHFEMS
jgi:hypothetical protein